MPNKINFKSFLKNEHAISEEFTTLPALSIVMMGFTLFIVLLAQTYTTYEERIQRINNYQIADNIAYKITNPDCYFMKPTGIINYPILQNDVDSLQMLLQHYQSSGVSFILRLRWDNQTKEFPPLTTPTNRTTVAVTKQVGISINEAQTIPGSLTIILWRNS